MTSASTFSRRAAAADKAGQKDTAKRLRKHAAKLRRDARAIAAIDANNERLKARRRRKPANKIVAGKTLEKARKRIAKKAPKEKHKILSALEQVLERTLGEAVTTGQGTMFAGINQDAATGERRWGIRPVPAAQLLGGDNSPNAIADVERIELEKRVDDIIRMAKAKKPDAAGVSPRDQILSALMMTKAIGDYEGRREAEQRHSKERVASFESSRDAIVCGFLAEIEDLMRMKSGIPKDMVYSIDSYRLCRIVDALNASGYTAKGKSDHVTDTDMRLDRQRGLKNVR